MQYQKMKNFLLIYNYHKNKKTHSIMGARVSKDILPLEFMRVFFNSLKSESEDFRVVVPSYAHIACDTIVEITKTDISPATLEQRSIICGKQIVQSVLTGAVSDVRLLKCACYMIFISMFAKGTEDVHWCDCTIMGTVTGPVITPLPHKCAIHRYICPFVTLILKCISLEDLTAFCNMIDPIPTFPSPSQSQSQSPSSSGSLSQSDILNTAITTGSCGNSIN